MGPKELRRALFLFGALIVLICPGICFGQSHFGYRFRGGYYEGVWNERPISGVDLQLMSVCMVVDEGDAVGSEATPGYLHLAFVIPGDFEDVDIAIRGPGNYLLDRVDREFQPGFNVFAWESRVVEGLRIHLEELEPLVSVVGGMYIPCFLYETEPTRMPPVGGYRVLFQTNIEGSIRYFVRDAGTLIVEDRVLVSANVPVETRLPATFTSDHVDLIAVLEYEADGGPRTVRQSFPIQVLHADAAANRGD